MGKLFKCVAVAVGGIALIAYLQSHAPEPRRGIDQDRIDEVNAKCEQLIGDSAPGPERHSMREICDGAKARLQRK